MTDDAVHFKKLRWRCRRGMRELDALLVRYLEQAYAAATPAVRAEFERLLETEDDVLWRYLSRRAESADPGQAALIDAILRLPHA